MSAQRCHVLFPAAVLVITLVFAMEISSKYSTAWRLSRSGEEHSGLDNITISKTSAVYVAPDSDFRTSSDPGPRSHLSLEDWASSFSWMGANVVQSEEFLETLFQRSVGSRRQPHPWHDALCDTSSMDRLADLTKSLMQALTSQALQLPGCLAHLPPYQRAMCILVAGGSFAQNSSRSRSAAWALKHHPLYSRTWCAQMNPCALWQRGTFRVHLNRSALRDLYATKVLPKLVASRHVAKPFTENFVHQVDLGFGSNNDSEHAGAAAALASEMQWLPERLAVTVKEVNKWSTYAAMLESSASPGDTLSQHMTSTNVLPVFQGKKFRLAPMMQSMTNTPESDPTLGWTTADNTGSSATPFLPYLTPIEALALLHRRLQEQANEAVDLPAGSNDTGEAMIPAMLFSGDSQTREVFFTIVSYLRSGDTSTVSGASTEDRTGNGNLLARHHVMIDTLKHHDVVYAVYSTGDELTLCSSRWNPAVKLPTVVEYVSSFRHSKVSKQGRPLFLIVFMWDPYTHHPRRDIWGDLCGGAARSSSSAWLPRCRNSRNNATDLSVGYKRMVAVAHAKCNANGQQRFCRGLLSMRNMSHAPVAVHVEGSRQWETTVKEGIVYEWDRSVCDLVSVGSNSGIWATTPSHLIAADGGSNRDASCKHRVVPLFYTLSSTSPYVLGREGQLMGGTPRVYGQSQITPSLSARAPVNVASLPQQVRKTYEHLHWLHQVGKDHEERQKRWHANRTATARSSSSSLGTEFRVGILDLAKLQMLPDVVMLDRTHFMCQVYRSAFSAHFRLAQTSLPLNNLMTPFPFTEPRAPSLSDVCRFNGSHDTASPTVGEVFARLFRGPLRKQMEALNGIRGNEVRNAFRSGLPVHQRIMYLAPKMPPGACRNEGSLLMMQLLLRDMAV